MNDNGKYIWLEDDEYGWLPGKQKFQFKKCLL